MRKLTYLGFSTAMMITLLLMPSSRAGLRAADFEGSEGEWLNRCSVPQSTPVEAAECKEFKAYYAEKSALLQTKIDSMNEGLAVLEDDIDELSSAIMEQKAIIDELDERIAENEESIAIIDEQIMILDEEIEMKQESIDQRNAIIVGRMRDEQDNIGMNMSLDVIMGANDLVDLIRKLDGLQRINENDQQEIDKIKVEKADLDWKKSEENRLKIDYEEKVAANESEQEAAEVVKTQQEELLQEYYLQVSDFKEQKLTVEADLNSLKQYMSSINTTLEGNYSFAGDVESFIKPVEGHVYNGTWHYSGGAPHLGADVSVSIGTEIYAPANGIILYAANGFPTNGGFLQNWVGYPSGAGNDIHMLTQVDGTTYAISFFHMANEGLNVLPGESVLQGDLLGLTGNSGNSSGAHCHIEVVNLGEMSIDDAIAQFQGSADFSWGTGWEYTGLLNVCGLSDSPCRERPEEVFGY